ncbi:hypothetical protein T08_15066 [Trichinella sp. T8]|nr:hypothetical protein T08_15066 [Trichinella sp. T8]
MYTVVGHALISTWLCTVCMGHDVRTASGQPVTFCSASKIKANELAVCFFFGVSNFLPLQMRGNLNFSQISIYLPFIVPIASYIVSLVHTQTQNAPQAGKSIQNV